MRQRKRIEEELKKTQEDINTMKLIMSNCYSDEGYRNYSKTLDKFIQRYNALERELNRRGE